VALALAVRLDADGVMPARYAVGLRRIARDAGYVKIDVVAAALDELVAGGWLQVEKGAGRPDRSQRPGGAWPDLYRAVGPPQGLITSGDQSPHVIDHLSAGDQGALITSEESIDHLRARVRSPEVHTTSSSPAVEPATEETSIGVVDDSLHPIAIIERFVEDGVYSGYVLTSARMLLRDDLKMSVEETPDFWARDNQLLDTKGSLDQLQQLPEHLLDPLLDELLLGQDWERYHPLDEIDNLIRSKLTTEAEVLARARALDEKIRSDGWDLGVETTATSLHELHEKYPWWFHDLLLGHVAPEAAA
jgi:hypothetical protein